MYSSAIGKFLGYTQQNSDEAVNPLEVTKEDALRAMIAHQAKTNVVNTYTMMKIYMAKKDAHIDGGVMDNIALQFESMRMNAFPSSKPFEQYGTLDHMQIDQILGTGRIYTAREVERTCIVANMCSRVGDTLLKQPIACLIAEHAIKFSKHRGSSAYLKLLPMTTMTEEQCKHFHDTYVSTVVDFKHFHAQERRAAHNLKPIPIAPKPPQAQEPISVSSSPDPAPEQVPDPEGFSNVLSDVDGLMNPPPTSYLQFLDDAVLPSIAPPTAVEVQQPSPSGFLPENMTVEQLASTITLEDVTQFIAEDLVRCNNATSFIMGEVDNGLVLPPLPKSSDTQVLPKKRKYDPEKEEQQAKIKRLEQMLKEPSPPPHMVNKFV